MTLPLSDLQGLIAHLENLELMNTISPGVFPLQYYLILQLALLHSPKTLSMARLVAKRTPKSAQNETFSLITNVGAALMHNDYAGAVSVLGALATADNEIGAVAKEVERCIKECAVNSLLGFESVTLHQAATLCGMKPEDLTPIVLKLGWNLEGEWLHPRRNTGDSLRGTGPGLRDLHALTDLLVGFGSA
ncbi:hypothetical protein HDU85_000564 [Gaertneriomyces sp. JEL0708]|nr:hypothetical protein HDU85_000564 [Gaertneriomyces sp. JEL0708]